ncbi:heterokaryon incompatibility protein-domain-containing protein, partial [Tricladium varicosporioides]
MEPWCQIRLETRFEYTRRVVPGWKSRRDKYSASINSLVEKWQKLPPRPRKESRGVPITLIDTINNCLVARSSNSEYAAISYVWGTTKTFKSTKKNSKFLHTPGAFTSCWNDLPLTISDAILVCISLGIPYLWVDAICIVQDDENDKHSQILNMHKIYANATLTIIALSGKHANAGLL